MSTTFKDNVPLSSGCFDIMVNDILQEFVDIMNKAIVKKGWFPDKSRAHHFGACSHLEDRTE